MRGTDRVIKVEVCPWCQKKYTDPVDRTAVKELGLCLDCDKRINYSDLEKRSVDEEGDEEND